MGYFIDVIKRYKDFSGRSTRTEYWMFILYYVITSIIVNIVDYFLGTGFLSLIFAIVIWIPSISIAARRLHDIGRSGWWQLIGLIPVIGVIVLIVFLVQDSHDENEYGPNPKLIKEEG